MLLLPHEGGRRVGHVPSFAESCPGDWYLSCLIWGAYRELAYFGSYGATENQGSKKEPAVPQTPNGIRD